jgi:hypothetical protein
LLSSFFGTNEAPEYAALRLSNLEQRALAAASRARKGYSLVQPLVVAFRDKKFAEGEKLS